MKKKGLLFGALLILTVLLTVCFSSCSEDSVPTLYVYNWGEYISDGSDDSVDVNREFEDYYYEKTGERIRVNYSTYSSNEDMYAKISSGAVQYDVIIPSDYMIQRMADEKLLIPLDMEKIPNYKYISEEYKGDNVYYEPNDGKNYSVPYFAGMVGVIYNSTIVSEDEENIGSWGLMWDEDYTGDILQFNNSRDAFGTALYYLGYDVNDATEEQWREALQLLKDQKSVVQGYVMDEIFNKMKSNSAAVSAYYAGDYLSMYEDNEDLAFFYPEEGTNIYIDAMCIPTGSQNYDLALEYINFMCRPDIAVANAEYTYYTSPLDFEMLAEDEEYAECYEEYLECMGEEGYDLLYGEPAKEAQKTATAYLNLSPESLALLNDLWEELKVESSIGSGIYVCCGMILAGLVAFTVYQIVRKRRWSKLYD